MANSDGLNRMIKLLELLGNPEKDFKAFHIAGTNGKGSTAYMIASVLEQSGYSVGLYTSPHLQEYYERIQLWDGEHHMISAQRFDELEAKVSEAESRLSEEDGPLHLFEKLTAIAYLYFEEAKPDYVVLECGLGGRLDSTNTIEKPMASIVTQIGLEHTSILGKTIFKIAREKAGIAKAGVPLVSQMKDMLVKNIMIDTARTVGCEFIDASIKVNEYRSYKLGMKGAHQIENAATAVEAIKAAGIALTDGAIERGLEKAVNPGRFEIIESDDRLWVLDGAHNPDAVDALIETYIPWSRSNRIRETLVLFGCMKDKNYTRIIQSMLSGLKGCCYATVNIDDERGESAEKLGEIIAEQGKSVVCFDSAKEAYSELRQSKYKAVLVFGSLYLVGSMRSCLLDK